MRIGLRNTYANVAATAALVLTLGGTGYAATTVGSDGAGAGGLPTVLGHHHTLKGAWGQSATAITSTDDIQTDSISFQVPLGKTVKAVVRQKGDGPSKHCPGSAKAPKAKPGFLCIYVGSGLNQNDVNTYSPVTGKNGSDQNYKFGAVVFWRPATVDRVFAAGTWAVTAK